MTQWRQLEDYITQASAQGQTTFTSSDLARQAGVGSAMIQAHQDAQRRPNSTTLYVIHRTGRTSNAVWHYQCRAQDAREFSRQFLDDMASRVVKVIEPDLQRMGVINPRANQLCTAILAAVEANLQLLAASL